MVHIHDNFAQAGRLISWLYHPRNLYLVMADCSTPLPAWFIDKYSKHENIYVFHDLPGVWGGSSLVAATVEAMRRALNIDKTWSVFTNISGSDVPLMPQEAMMQTLVDGKAAGQTTFIADFGACGFDPLVHVDDTIHEWSDIPFRSDVLFRIYGRARGLFERMVESPITRPGDRHGIHVYEDFGGKTLHIRPLFHMEQTARRIFFDKRPYHFGRQWIVMERKLCEFICADDSAAEIFEHLKTVMVPDECFFQTLLSSITSKFFGIVHDNNFRYHYGTPYNLTDKDLSSLISSNAFFARKLSDNDNGEIIEHAWKNTYAARF
jgi:hypothetical protein